MRTGWPALAASALFIIAFAPVLEAQQRPVIRMDFSNPGLNPPQWSLIIRPDGSGHFQSHQGDPPAASARSFDSPKLAAPDLDRDVHLTAQFAGRAFQVASTRKWFNVKCESPRKVAFQGKKTLSYAGPDGQGSCEFNYSADKEIQSLGDSLLGVAGTILEGARLEMLLLHDRLGLDKEMEYVTEAQGDGRLQQICAIHDILERLADDQGVMQRVRKRSRALLEKTSE